MATLKAIYQIVDPADTFLRFGLSLLLILAGFGVAIVQPYLSPLVTGLVGAGIGIILLLAALKDTKMIKI